MVLTQIQLNDGQCDRAGQAQAVRRNVRAYEDNRLSLGAMEPNGSWLACCGFDEAGSGVSWTSKDKP